MVKFVTIASSKSMGASFSDVIGELYGSQFTLEMGWTGTVAGTLYVEATCGGSIWNKIAGTDIVVNNAGQKTFNYSENNNYKQLRIVFTRTSGTGSFNAVLAKPEQE